MTVDRPTNIGSYALLFLARIYETLDETSQILPPMQYIAIAKDIGLDHLEMGNALRLLEKELLIAFRYPTQSLGSTNQGVQRAEYLKFRQENLLLNDPLPTSLENVHAEIDRWEQKRQEQLPRSHQWEQISARLEGLRHRENTMMKQNATPTVYIASGIGSRVNIGSVDNSVNSINEADVFPTLRGEIEAQIQDPSEKHSALAKLNEMEEAKGSPSYGGKLKELFSISADVVKIVQPFIQPLLAHIK